MWHFPSHYRPSLQILPVIPYDHIEQSTSTVSVGADKVDETGMDEVKTGRVEVGGMSFGDSGIDVASESCKGVVGGVGTDEVVITSTDGVD